MQRAEEIARLAPESPEYMPLLGPQTVPQPAASPPPPPPSRPTTRPRPPATAWACAPAKNLTAAGFLDGGARFQALRNSKGLEAYQQSTNTDFSVTVRTADGTRLGLRHCRRTPTPAKFNAKALTQLAADKAAGLGERQGH